MKMIDTILFPSSYFNKKQVDEDLKKEYDAAKDTGLYNGIIIFSYEDWFHDEKIVLNTYPENKITAVYRGWMMQPKQYEKFYNTLKECNIELVTTPEEYKFFHVFPNIYEYIKVDTPKTLIYPKGTEIDLSTVKKTFNRFMVKDYVKSVKGTDFPVFFENSVSQEEFDSWMNKFYEYRGNLFTGGICVKEFVDLKRYGNAKNEYRVFYINGEIATISRNSGQPDSALTPPSELIEKYNKLNSKFYTVDYAELTDGSWIIIEAGDGSVSGLSDFQDYNAFFRSLYYSFL